jgi:hypothetical protein
MTTPLYLAVQAGFVLLTIVYLGLFVSHIRNGVRLTSWEDSRKKKFINRLIAALVIWAVFVSGWSLSGKMSDFTIFPFNLMPVYFFKSIGRSSKSHPPLPPDPVAEFPVLRGSLFVDAVSRQHASCANDLRRSQP